MDSVRHDSIERAERPSARPRPVDARLEQYVEDLAVLDPVRASFLGLPGYDHALPDLSPEGYDAREALHRAALSEVSALTPVDRQEALARDTFMERVGLAVSMFEGGVERSHLAVVFDTLHFIQMAFDLMPTDTDEAWRNIDRRLAALPETLRGYRATLDTEASAGRVVAQRQYDAVAVRLLSWAGDGARGNVFAQLVAKAPAAIPRSLRADLDQHAAQAAAALADLARFLRDGLVPRGRSTDAVGREAYALASRQHLGATIDLEEAYEWGWFELKRIRDAMDVVARQILPGASVPEAVAHLDADPSRQLAPDDFRRWMQEVTDTTIDELAGVHFEIPAPIRRMECEIAPTSDGAKYYTAPSEDFTRPGRMWWSVPGSVATLSPWRELTTVFHEGVPGHHLQVANTFYRKDLLNRWQRQMCWVSGHGEGWAVYAERLMLELGYLDDPAAHLGMLDQQSLRAARVVVDIGMHLQLTIPHDNPFSFHPGERWDPVLAREFMGQHCLMEGPFLDFEINRYLGLPGQASSYKLGERVWLEARAEMQALQGAEFDLKAFHTSALNLGSLGLDTFRAALRDA